MPHGLERNLQIPQGSQNIANFGQGQPQAQTGGQFGGGLDIASLLASIGGGGPGFLAQAGLKTLPALFGGIASLFRGKSFNEKQREQLVRQLQRRRNRPVISQQQIGNLIPQIEQTLSPALNRIAGRAAQRVGLGSGVGQGELARANLAGISQPVAQLSAQAPQINAQNQLAIEQLIAQLTGG